MSPRQLAAAIRKGHTMISENRWVHWDQHRNCGCALGAALVGSGVSYKQYAKAVEGREKDFDSAVGELLQIQDGLAIKISTKHVIGMPRLEIANWLETLDVSKPKDAQSFNDFMKVVTQPVEMEAA